MAHVSYGLYLTGPEIRMKAAGEGRKYILSLIFESYNNHLCGATLTPEVFYAQ